MKSLTVTAALVLAFIVGLSNSCRIEDEPPATEDQAPPIDRRSYDLGAIGAFAEMVDAGVKTLALSAPLSPAEMDALVEDARRITANHAVEVYRETDFLVTDLFPADLTEGKHVLLIYRGTTKQDYLDLKVAKQRLIESDRYDAAARVSLARRLGGLLSYTEEKIDALLAARDPDR
jgi:hypothetical protein